MPTKTTSMAKIPIALDEELLRAVDRAVQQTKQSRSSFIREALKGHLVRLRVLEQERQEREAYARQPQTEEELSFSEVKAFWPPE